mmetsp:Transcript_42023/g.68008  ORF Transcript_42023/g.68008 Transcript_42023/m.68008 type:complete len:98 (-) Transcript_42023:181-474(-)
MNPISCGIVTSHTSSSKGLQGLERDPIGLGFLVQDRVRCTTGRPLPGSRTVQTLPLAAHTPLHQGIYNNEQANNWAEHGRLVSSMDPPSHPNTPFPT